MKKAKIFLIVVLLLICICACTGEDSGNTVMFYYPRLDFQFGTADGVIGKENTNFNKNSLSVDDIVAEYLKGPASAQYTSPLTGNSKTFELYNDGNTIRFIFDDSIAKVPSTELTAALAALALTCLENSTAQEVHISAETVILNGEMTLIYTKENILLWDNFIESVPDKQAKGE